MAPAAPNSPFGLLPEESDRSDLVSTYTLSRNSNAHSYSMSSHTCPQPGYRVCEYYECNARHMDTRAACDEYGCNFNPYRMGATDFYGAGKLVDTTKPFTCAAVFWPSSVSS